MIKNIIEERDLDKDVSITIIFQITGCGNPDYWVKYPVILITGPSNPDYWVQ